VIAINTQSGFNPSNINVFHRNANTGTLSPGGSPVTFKYALGLIAGEMHSTRVSYESIGEIEKKD